MKVTIDPQSGFCFGVKRAIEIAEGELSSGRSLFCLGDIVHNGEEVARLEAKGLKIITRDEFASLHDCAVMVRAHGEPPETYRIAAENNIELIDASCPIVLKLQQKVKRAHHEMKLQGGQVVIYGKEGHAEVEGLNGQTGNTAIVVGSEAEIDKIDFSKPVTLFSQTTKDVDGFQRLVSLIDGRMQINQEGTAPEFVWRDTICRKVSDRAGQLRTFAANHDVVVFVSGKKSSNGMILHQVCREINSRTHLVAAPGEVKKDWFVGCSNVGVCGATSTPAWLMQAVADEIEKFNT